MKNGVSKISPATSSSGVTVRVKISSLSGVKLAESTVPGELVNFDVKALMEEKERRSGQISVGYSLKVGTKPNVAKYEVEGVAALEGKDEDIRKMLEVNPETQIPFVFQRVYQHVFMSMYLLATLIDAPYPPPNLLSTSQQTPTVQMDTNVVAPALEKTVPPAPISNVQQKETTP
ncbi:MAG: hypothetical protein WCC63_01285 [Candidatus Bathyarchaeia archaeon]